MKHGMIRVAVIGLIASGVALADTASVQPLRTGGEWAISLDAGGRVETVRQTTTLKPLLAEPIERAIRGWSFEPGRIDGQPQPTETSLALSITLQPAGNGGYAIRIDDARVGGRIDKIPEVRVDPRDVREGTFLYVARVAYAEDGKVVSINPERGTPEVPSGVRRNFERVLRGATFVPEHVGRHGIAAEIAIPMCVSTSRSGKVPPPDACEWTPPHRSAPIGTDRRRTVRRRRFRCKAAHGRRRSHALSFVPAQRWTSLSPRRESRRGGDVRRCRMPGLRRVCAGRRLRTRGWQGRRVIGSGGIGLSTRTS